MYVDFFLVYNCTFKCVPSLSFEWELAARLIRRSQVAGHRSQVMGCRLQVADHRSQITGYEIIISCSPRGKHKTYVYCSKTVSLIISSLVINSFSVLIVLYYSWKSDGCPFIISLNCNIKADCFQHNIYNRNWLFLTNITSAEECSEIWEKVRTVEFPQKEWNWCWFWSNRVR